MLRNGTDLWAALSVLERQDFGSDIRAMTTKMIEQVSVGAALEDIIGNEDRFPLVVRFALTSGRASGRIPETLIALADTLEQAANLGLTLSSIAPESPIDFDVSASYAPVVRLVNKILWDASRQQATAVHVRASESRRHTSIEFRVGDEWREAVDLPIDLLGPICRRLCIMAGINWALKRPALGTLRVGEREEDVRGTVQFVPGDSELDQEVRVALSQPNET